MASPTGVGVGVAFPVTVIAGNGVSPWAAVATIKSNPKTASGKK
jgi:hypothetical protein